jgi:hypothetical protein
MAALPSYVRILFAGYGEEFDPSVERTEMERGVPKQRVINSQVMQELHATLLFSSTADAGSFETWYFDTIKRVGFFDFVHPRTGATHSGRFKDASIGRLEPRNARYSRATRAVVIEYLR